MEIPQRFQELFNIEGELSEREPSASQRAGDSGLIRLATAAAGLVLEASWMSTAAAVFFALAGTPPNPLGIPVWHHTWWGLLLIGLGGMGLAVVQRLSKSEGPVQPLSVLQTLLLAAFLTVPALWLGLGVVPLASFETQPLLAAVRSALAGAVSLFVLAVLLQRLAPLRLQQGRAFAYQRFTWATVAFAGSAVVLGLGIRYGDAGIGALSPWWALAYLASGLLLLALTPELQRPGTAKAALSDPRERIMFTLAAAGLVSLIGIVLAVVLFPRLIGIQTGALFGLASLFMRGVGAVWDLLTQLAVIIVLPIGYLVELVVWLLRRLLTPDEMPEQPQLEAPGEPFNPEDYGGADMPAWVDMMVQVLPVVIVLAAAWFILRKVQQLLREGTSREMLTDTRESTGTGLLRWFDRRLSDDEEDTEAVPQDSSAPSTQVERIRAAFRRFLEAAASSYRPIETSETARRFYHRLDRHLETAAAGDLSAEMYELLRVYEAARYGHIADESQVETAEAAAQSFAEWVQSTEESKEGPTREP